MEEDPGRWRSRFQSYVVAERRLFRSKPPEAVTPGDLERTYQKLLADTVRMLIERGPAYSKTGDLYRRLRVAEQFRPKPGARP